MPILQAMGNTLENTMRYHRKWLWGRVRRVVPQKDTLYSDLRKLFDTYAGSKDAKTGQV
jgi:hypothetical protein